MKEAINRAARQVPVWAVYALGMALLALPVVLAAAGLSGPDPVKVLEHELGLGGLQLLIATLCVTPLRWAGINLLKFRRALGLLAFAAISLHFLTWIVLDMGLRWSEVLTDLTRRPYIVVGFAAFLALIPLAVTSNNASIRRLGAAAWTRLHKLAYPAILAGAVHFVMIGKVYTLESGLYLAVILALIGARVWKRGSVRALVA
jgi:sulfoxide reductase heme-binding subunit YedZ